MWVVYRRVVRSLDKRSYMEPLVDVTNLIGLSHFFL